MSLAPIIGIVPQSPMAAFEIALGDCLIAINGKPIIDVLDYKFYSYDKKLSLRFQKKTGEEYEYTLEKEEGLDLGLEFETYLMDKARSCANQCIFCFVDQMPKGMRSSLYFKDDDARLSFLTGNYITLTNLSQREIQRIIDVRISPINVSVHTTNPELRTRMLKHPKAGDCLATMQRLAEGKITMNCQIVACPTYNDGEELQRTLEDLSKLYPQVHSISVVPIGITKYRDDLPYMESYHQNSASEVLDLVEAFGKQQQERYGTTFVWCSDEFYLQAKRELPEEEYYEEFTQLDNGVGMLRMLQCEFGRGLALMEGEEFDTSDFTIATGTAAAPMLATLLQIAQEKSQQEGYHWNARVIPIENDFFGHAVNVAGLVTGQDLCKQLQGRTVGTRLLLPESMLRHGEDVFLDDVTISQVEAALSVTIIPVPQDGYDLVDAMFDVFTPAPRHSAKPQEEDAYRYNPPSSSK